MERLDTQQISVGLSGTPSKTDNQKKYDNKNQDASKSSDSTHCIVAHCNLGINEMTSLSYYTDCWLLDTGATSHMTFREDCFEELNETINGIVYFVDNSSLKPKGIGTIRLKMHGFPHFLLKNVLYLLEMQRSLLSMAEIRQQGHSIHMFDGIIEIRKSSNNQVIMTGYEDGKLLKLKGSSTRFQNYVILTKMLVNLLILVLLHILILDLMK